MVLELRRLRYLIVLAKRLSYSRAAEDLGLSQSALSRAIQSLERDFGMRLFDRDRAGVMLTEQGRWVVEKAEALLTSAADFEHQISFAAKGGEGRTRFGLTALAASALLPATLSDRLAQSPAFSHEVLVGDVETLWLELAQGQIEFMVCSEWNSAWGIPEGMPVRIESLARFPISLILRNGHPLLGAEAASKDFPLLVSSPSSVVGQLTVKVRQHFAASVQVIEDFGVLRSLVRTTNAIWLSSSYAVAEELSEGIYAELPLPAGLEPRSFELGMYSLVRRTKSPAALEIAEAFRKRIRALSQMVQDRYSSGSRNVTA
jgi:DNA-binding transcriptional LysR family regulator